MCFFVDTLLIKVVDYGYRVLRKVLHYVLALGYWSRGKSVTPVNDSILKMSATELAKQIREGRLKSETVIRAFTKRILEVEPDINAIAVRRFEDALLDAREVDALIASGSITRQQMAKDKPLLGVPFTAKAIFTVKDLPCTAGSLLLKNIRGHLDAPPVKLMKQAGAILLATTNLPEMGMGVESTNYLYGTTCNPYDTNRTSGGSTGGEGALLGAGGSVIGLGNDMAGSIRIPSMFSGVFGHKPTIGVVSNGGSIFSPAAEHLLYTGPLCRYAEDLVTTMKVLTSQDKKNPNFDRKVNLEGLKVFYIPSLGNIPLVDQPNEDIRNAVTKVISHFESKFGSKSQRIIIPLLKKVNMIWAYTLLSPDQNLTDSLTMGKAKVSETREVVKLLFRRSLHTLGVVAMMNLKSFPRIYNPDKVELYQKLKEELEDQFNFLDDKSILIMPTMPFAAPYHGEMSFSAANICYCNVFNVTGLPSTQCPVGLNDEGLPVGVQIIGKKGSDALTIACAAELEKAFGGWMSPK